MTQPPNITPGGKRSFADLISKARGAFADRRTSIGITVAAVAALLLWLLASPNQPKRESSADSGASNQVVRLVGPRLISVSADSPLERKLSVAPAAREQTSAPLLTVTGSIVARLPPGAGAQEGRWDFSALEIATAYADWLRAKIELPHAQKQLAKTRDLSNARVNAQTKLVERLRKLVAAGTDSPRDLAAAEADLLQMQLQGQKDVFDAEAAVNTADRTLSTLERQLYQAGADPQLLARAKEGTAVIVAEIPEARMSLAHEGESCDVRFYGIPGEVFAGKVGSLAPTVAKDRRTLRVFFELDDPKGILKPGMFAEVGLGTDVRDALFVPSEALLHVGRSDYVLVREKADVWRIAEVDAGETRGSTVEIHSGLEPGDQVMGSGAILLKPLVVQAVQG